MEKLTHKRSGVLLAAALSTTALTGCYSDGYSSSWRINSNLTIPYDEDGIVSFSVRCGESAGAAIKVRLDEQQVSFGISGNITGSTQPLENDDFTTPMPLVEGPEMVVYVARGAWTIDATENNVALKGSCNGV